VAQEQAQHLTRKAAPGNADHFSQPARISNPANEHQVPATQLPLAHRGLPSEEVTKASVEYIILQSTQVIYSGACWEREVTRTSARLACEAESSSQGTQALNTKPEHPG